MFRRRVLVIIRPTVLQRLGLLPVGALVVLALVTVAPTPSTVEQTDPGPLAGWIVAVDAGHGGKDRGACHFPSNTIEKEINLDVALRLADRLTAAGAEPVLTRQDDTLISLSRRAETANEAGAHLFVSIHANRFPAPDCFGAQAFYLPGSEAAEQLARLMQEELVGIQPENRRSALPGRYRVLQQTHMPAVLVEVGFVTSPVDRRLLADTHYRDRLAGAILRAMERYAAGEGGAPDRGSENPDIGIPVDRPGRKVYALVQRPGFHRPRAQRNPTHPELK